MDYLPFLGSISIIIPLIAVAFVAILFILIGFDLQWRLRGVLLLVLLIIASSVLGVIGIGNLLFMGFPQDIKLEDAPGYVDFQVYVPDYLPEGIKFRNVEIFPGPDINELTITYGGLGDDLTIIESKTGGMGMGFGIPGSKREKIRIKGRPARIVSEEDGFNSLFMDIEEVVIEIDTTLQKEELIKVANSLKKLDKK